jgi:diphosphomevalonate decarboxylase
MLQALKSGDIEKFGRITEAEALMLHALMMTSSPSFVLMEPSSLEIIKKVQNFRKETSIPLYFTLDAGPNVHLLYPHSVEEKVNQFISAELSQHCDQNQVIRDFVGKGLEKL